MRKPSLPLMNRLFRLLVCLSAILLLSSCSSKTVPFPPAFPAVISMDTGDTSWWMCRFKVSWPPETEANATVDLFLAHAVVDPVLRDHVKDLAWWRFHRRAGRDEAGHQFSFIFYSSSSVAAQIMDALKASAALRLAVEAGVVEKILFDDPAQPGLPQVEATSDKGWSPELQRQWPSYIMGVSSLWLGLIGEFMNGTAPCEDISCLLDQYREANSKVTALWRNEGQHAFLHHLSAVFGYEPLLIRKAIRF